jgi:hypothetical protein
MRITWQELYSLIQGLSDLHEAMSRIESSDDFRLSNDYEISGYEIEKISILTRKANDVISNVSYEIYGKVRK